MCNLRSRKLNTFIRCYQWHHASFELPSGSNRGNPLTRTRRNVLGSLSSSPQGWFFLRSTFLPLEIVTADLKRSPSIPSLAVLVTANICDSESRRLVLHHSFKLNQWKFRRLNLIALSNLISETLICTILYRFSLMLSLCSHYSQHLISPIDIIHY